MFLSYQGAVSPAPQRFPRFHARGNATRDFPVSRAGVSIGESGEAGEAGNKGE
jgi:hypothetical protein